ncbi:MAG: PH domain-containing protein [Clostridiales Family XIII bacterium]|jgi:putative membrane protein|nr:PH domain-containing protein [Clostridiales Family XIII bacterium]
MSEYLREPIDISQPQRVSNAYIGVFLIRNLRAWIIVFLIYAAGPILQGDNSAYAIVPIGPYPIRIISIMLVAITLIVLLTLLFSFLSYRRIRWQVSGGEVHIKKGILRRVDKRIPIAKIQSVDISESLTERIFKVATVKIDTAGGEGDDGKIPCIRKDVSSYMRDRIFAIKNAEAEPTQNPAPDGLSAACSVPQMHAQAMNTGTAQVLLPNVVYRMPLKNLILTGLSNSKALLIALIILGGLSQFADIFFKTVAYESAYTFLSTIAIPGLIAIVVAFFFASWFISVLGVLISNFGFTVRNEASKIEIERGLIDHKTISIEKNRIQEVRISQGLIRRIIGYAEISVTTATLKVQAQSGGKGANEGVLGLTVLHPFISMNEVDFFLKTVLPDFDGRPREFNALPRRADFRSIRRYVLWMFPFVLIAWLSISFIFSAITGTHVVNYVSEHLLLIILTSLPVLIFMGITGHLSYRGKGVSVNDRFLSVRTGAWGRKYSFVPRRKIQTARISVNPFQAHARLATLAGTTGAHAFPSLRDVDFEYGAQYLEWSVLKT